MRVRRTEFAVTPTLWKPKHCLFVANTKRSSTASATCEAYKQRWNCLLAILFPIGGIDFKVRRQDDA